MGSNCNGGTWKVPVACPSNPPRRALDTSRDGSVPQPTSTIERERREAAAGNPARAENIIDKTAMSRALRRLALVPAVCRECPSLPQRFYCF